MSEMREWWANVYEGVLGEPGMIGVAHAGQHHGDPGECEYYSFDMDDKRHPDLICRIHVRLKPEGAPKRYADDVERYAWEEAERLGLPPQYA